MPPRIAEFADRSRSRRPALVTALVAGGVLLLGTGVAIGEHAANHLVAQEFTTLVAPLLPGGQVSVTSAEVTGGPAVALLAMQSWSGTIRGTDSAGAPVSMEVTGLDRNGSAVDEVTWVLRAPALPRSLRGVPETALADVMVGDNDVRVQLTARADGENAVIEVYGAWVGEAAVAFDELPASVRDGFRPATAPLPSPMALVDDVRFETDQALLVRLVAHDVALL